MTNNPLSVNSVSAIEPSYPTAKGLRKEFVRGAIALLTLTLLGGAGYVAYRQFAIARQADISQVITLPVERRTLSITVSANGTVKPERSINVSPKSTGVLTTLLVKEGDTIQEGQILAYMDNSNLQGQLTQSKAQLASAEASLEKLLAGNRPEDIAQSQARLNSAQASLQQADDNLRRYQALANAGAISLQSLNQYKTNRDTAQAQVMEAQQALALAQKGSRPEDINQARAQVESAKGSLQSIQTQLNDTIIRAPFSGIVTKKYADPGAFVAPTTAGSSVSSATSSSILALASTNQVVANVSENNIDKIRLGQTVTIQADAFPGKTFTGRVIQIAAQSTVEQNVTSFEVKMALADPEKRLRSGMNVSVVFNVGQVQAAIAVPTAAVVRQNNVTGVFVARTSGQPLFTPITTGATVGRHTEVKSGLQGNEQVLLSFPPGDRPQSTVRSFPGLPGGNSQPAGFQPGAPAPMSAPMGGPPPGGGASSSDRR